MREPEFKEVEETPEEKAINDKIDEWHLNYEGELSLHEFLGWTYKEYGIWVTTGEIPNA